MFHPVSKHQGKETQKTAEIAYCLFKLCNCLRVIKNFQKVSADCE